MVETHDLGDDERMNDSFKGATYRVERGEGNMYDIELILHTPTDGFQVGAINGTYVQTHTPIELNALLRTCAYVHADVDYVGYWLDDEGMYHIDPSHYYSEDDYYHALNQGIKNQQRSIWSFIQGAEVPVATKQAFHYFKDSAAPVKAQNPYQEWKESLAVLLAAINESKDATRYMEPNEVVAALFVEFGDEFLEMISQKTEAV